MTTLFTPTDVRNAIEVLASRSLIRLVTEIDDSGAIPPRRLAGTLSDLSSHQLRRAVEAARDHGLVRTEPGAGLKLTDSGAELADLYDGAARWARRHAYPAPVCEFSSRIRHVLDLLAPSLMTERADGLSQPSAARLLSEQAQADLSRPRALLIQWLASNPEGSRAHEPAA
ncbi:regulator [Streptomyces sp. NPDC055243]|uniref:regulator n=1 Tax=Streptomyces sp. NPDC055243 TaxID=3365720 RepID=UPI0037CF14FF